MASGDERTRALVIVGAGTIVGGALIASQAWLRAVARQWLLADPDLTASRARLLLAGLGVMLVAPLLGFAVYMWRRAAVEPVHGRVLKALASFLVIAGAGLAAMLWRLTALLTG